jgi:hypothetical protein
MWNPARSRALRRISVLTDALAASVVACGGSKGGGNGVSDKDVEFLGPNFTLGSSGLHDVWCNMTLGVKIVLSVIAAHGSHTGMSAGASVSDLCAVIDETNNARSIAFFGTLLFSQTDLASTTTYTVTNTSLSLLGNGSGSGEQFYAGDTYQFESEIGWGVQATSTLSSPAGAVASATLHLSDLATGTALTSWVVA